MAEHKNTEKKLARLLDQLLAQTRAGNLSWTEAGYQEFSVSFDNLSITLEFDASNEDYKILIYNEEGKAVESFGPATVLGHTAGNAYPMFRDLYEEARRTAYNVDDVLNNLLKKLGGDA